ncbi:MAG: sulfatase [Acidobacteriota bacterium]
MILSATSNPTTVRRPATIVRTRWILWRRVVALFAGLLAASAAFAGAESPIAGARDEGTRRFPDIVLLSVDTLRYDRLSLHGYARPTSPAIDALLGAGVRFDQARVVEPLTAPSMASILTSLHPHEHGASRNGLGVRPGLPSLPRMLAARGYRTGAFVGNWTLRDEMVRLGDHFDDYSEVFSRKRWLGLFYSEATADDLNREALEWAREHIGAERRWPFFLWVHYVEPHEPYRYWDDLAPRLGRLDPQDDSDRYDTEVAFVDRAIGSLLSDLQTLVPRDELLVIFVSDHGESLGEHDYWGHGRNLFDPGLRVPMGLTWHGRLRPAVLDTPASSLDLTPTILGLLGLDVPDALRGHDWSPMLRGEAAAPADRVTWHQAHKGAVQRRGNERARRQGLLAVARVGGDEKVVLDLRDQTLRRFELGDDPGELRGQSAANTEAEDALQTWLEAVQRGLAASDELPPPSLDEEDLEQLRALGYID